MPHINLLPWREELRKRRQKEFLVTAALSVAAMGLVVAAVHLQYNTMIEFQNQRNEFLTQQIAALDRKIKEIRTLEDEKARLLARMEIIQQLQSSRPEIVHLMDTLVATLPEGVYYKKISQKGNVLSIDGVAQSNARVSSLMRNYDGAEWLTNPALVQITARREGDGAGAGLRLADFSLRVTQASRAQPEGGEGAK